MERGTRDEDKLKITVFNVNKAGQDKAGQDKAGQDKAGQDKAGQGRHTGTPGVTSRPDQKELNRQEINTQDN